jgi:hypothetical protein
MNLIDIYSIFHPTTAECKFFSTARETFSKVGHILGHKTSLNNVKTVEGLGSGSVMECLPSRHEFYPEFYQQHCKHISIHTEIIYITIFSDYNHIKLEFSHRRNFGNYKFMGSKKHASE